MRKLAAAFALFFTLLLPSFAAAQLPPGGTGLNQTAEQGYGANVTNTQNSNLGLFIGSYIIKPVIGLTGLIFLVLTIYSGVMWMTSAGDSKRIEHAKNVLVASITGVVIITTAYVVVNTVINALTGV